MSYVELHARSAFSFLRGGSMPEHLAERAAELRMSAMALCDRDGVYGAPRFYKTAREQNVRPIVGCELTMEDGYVLPVLVESRAGYQNLCRLITRAKLRGTKEHAPMHWSDLPDSPAASSRFSPSGKSSASHGSKRLLAPLGEAVFVEIQRHACG